MPYTSIITVSPSTKTEAVEAIGGTAGLTPGSLVAAQTVDPVTHLRSARHMGKNVFTATKRDTLANSVIQSNVASLLDQV